jgi:hypothetical protein
MGNSESKFSSAYSFIPSSFDTDSSGKHGEEDIVSLKTAIKRNATPPTHSFSVFIYDNAQLTKWLKDKNIKTPKQEFLDESVKVFLAVFLLGFRG